jgi:hypothetical protein
VDADEQQAALARALVMRSGPERESALVDALADEAMVLGAGLLCLSLETGDVAFMAKINL